MSTTAKFPEESYATVNRAESTLAEMHRLRLRRIHDGKWPHWCDDEWHARAARARATGDMSGAAVRAIATSDAIHQAQANRHRSAA